MQELQRDRLIGRVPPQNRPLILERAWQRGWAAAEAILTPVDCSFQEILSRAGISVIREPSDRVYGNTRYFAEYQVQKKCVILYQQAIQLWCAHHNLSTDLGEQLILAHEYFHALEQELTPSCRDIYSVYRLTLGPWRFFPCGLQAVSEIGAHGFAAAVYQHRMRGAGINGPLI